MRTNFLIFSMIIGAAMFFAIYPLTSGWAYAARSKADQDARDRETARYDREIILEATRDDRANSVRVVAYSIGGSIAASALGLAAAWVMFAIGKARAATAQAMIAARCIPLDPATRQYPLVLDNPQQPRFAYNPNTGAIVRLTAPQQADPQLAVGAVVVQTGRRLTVKGG